MDKRNTNIKRKRKTKQKKKKNKTKRNKGFKNKKKNKMSSSTTTKPTVNAVVAKKRKNVNELNTKPAKVAKAEKDAKVDTENSKVKFVHDSLCLRSLAWITALEKIGHGVNEDHLKELSDQFVHVGSELKGMVDDCTDALCAAWENYSETIADFKDNGCQIMDCTWMPYKEEDVRAAIEMQRALNQFFCDYGFVTIGSKVLVQEDPVWAEIPNSDSDRYDVGLGVVGVVDYAGFNVKRGTGMKGPVYIPSIYVKLPDGTRLYFQGYGCKPISDWQIKVFDFLNKHPEFRDKYDLTHTDVDVDVEEETWNKLKFPLDRPLELLDLVRRPSVFIQKYIFKVKITIVWEMLLLIQQDNKAIIQELLDFLVVVEKDKPQKVFGLDDVTVTFPGYLPRKKLQSIVENGKKFGYIEDDVNVVRKHYTVKISLERVILMFSELIETDPDLKDHYDIFKNNEWYGFEKDAPAEAATTTTANP